MATRLGIRSFEHAVFGGPSLPRSATEDLRNLCKGLQPDELPERLLGGPLA